jgi:hypothetical protein
MKKALRTLGFVAVAALAVAGTWLTFVYFSGIPRYSPGHIDLKVERTPERIERGKKLVGLLCQQCHYNPKTGGLTGRYLDDAPPEFGKAYSANITNHPEFGIGSWTDGEIAYLLRTGVKRDGQYAPPYMPKLPLISDEDLFSVIAFLRSDNELVRSRDAQTIPCAPSFLTKFLCRVAFSPLPYPENPVIAPDPADITAYGRYLACAVVDCYSCHSADFTKADPINPEKSLGFFGGGNEMRGTDGRVVVTANITPDKETGIGNWTQEEFIEAVRVGRRPDGKQLRLPMPPYVMLDSADAAAIYSFLRTVPPIVHDIPRNW